MQTEQSRPTCVLLLKDIARLSLLTKMTKWISCVAANKLNKIICWNKDNMSIAVHVKLNMGKIFCNIIPAGIWCENDVVLTSMRRDYVASTLIRRHCDTKCPLGYL